MEDTSVPIVSPCPKCGREMMGLSQFRIDKHLKDCEGILAEQDNFYRPASLGESMDEDEKEKRATRKG